MRAGTGFHIIAAVTGLGLLSACGGMMPRSQNGPTDIGEPTPILTQTQIDNQIYYQRYVDHQLAQGLMRTDAGGPDTPFDMRDVLDTFEQLAFYDEYDRNGSFDKTSAMARLSRWEKPVRFNIIFGDTIPLAERIYLQDQIDAYATRLSQLTQHSIKSTRRNGNFDVVFVGHDDATKLNDLLDLRRPIVGPDPQRIVAMMPRDVHCLVMAFSNQSDGAYDHAIAVIRAENPAPLKTACIHEELAQGLGLANDSPRARPSIFNDDDEFATLTTMDGVMLQVLYDKRLRSGMTIDDARTILHQIGADLNQPNS
jgi:hypothetical protein